MATPPIRSNFSDRYYYDLTFPFIHHQDLTFIINQSHVAGVRKGAWLTGELANDTLHGGNGEELTCRGSVNGVYVFLYESRHLIELSHYPWLYSALLTVSVYWSSELRCFCAFYSFILLTWAASFDVKNRRKLWIFCSCMCFFIYTSQINTYTIFTAFHVLYVLQINFLDYIKLFLCFYMQTRQRYVYTVFHCSLSSCSLQIHLYKSFTVLLCFK